MALVSFTQMLDAAIGTDNDGTVNFRALRNLLQAMLGHLGLQDSSSQGLEQPAERDSSSSKDMPAYQDLLEENRQLKEAQLRMQEEMRMMQEALGLGNVRDAASQLPGLCNLRTLSSDVQMLKERLGLYPEPQEVNNMVSWDVLEDCLVGSKGDQGRDGGRPRGEQEGEQSATTKPPTWDMDIPHGASSELGSRDSSLGLKDPGTALMAPKQQASLSSGHRRDASTTAAMQTVSQDTQTTTLGTQPEPTVPQLSISGERLSTQLHQAGPLAASTLLPTAQGFEIPVDTDPRARSHVQEPALPSGSSSAYGNDKCFVETVKALKETGKLRYLYAALKEQVAQLEATKLDRTELEKLHLLLQQGGQGSIANMLSDLKGLSRDLQGQKGKIRKLESSLGKLEADRASWQKDLSSQLGLPLGSTPKEVKRDMKDAAEQQQISKAALDQLVTQTAEKGQEQLEELRVMESTGQEEAVCPACSGDTSSRLGKLLRCYEKLQGMVDSLMLSKKRGKVVRQLPGKSQDQEALKEVQAAILQMQGEHEKLSSVTGSLLDESRQQQKDIEGLFQSMERLEKEKADKEDLELGMDEKADKDALESKVSRAQFEASLELLDKRNQEVLSRVTGQEQGLHEVQQQLREEMATKLDCRELGPFQQQLEERWKSGLEQLKETAPPTEADDAAGIRKQLLADFQCLSCDRQLSMRVPGSPIPPIPPSPPLVPHVAGQSQPVGKMEQTHRERMAACKYPTVPRQCGGQRTLTPLPQRSLRLPLLQPSAPQALRPSSPRLPLLQPSAPQALRPSSLLPSKHDKKEQLGQDSRRAEPSPSAPGTSGPLQDRSGSSHSQPRRVHWPHQPVQPHWMAEVTQQRGRTGGHRLNPSAPAPGLARK